MSSLTPSDPRDRRVTESAKHVAAVRYIEENQARHLDENQLIDGCVAVLVAFHDVPDAHTAHRLTLDALGEVQARSKPAWVDLDLSTSQVVRVVDPIAGLVATFTASELIKLALDRDQVRKRSRAVVDKVCRAPGTYN